MSVVHRNSIQLVNVRPAISFVLCCTVAAIIGVAAPRPAFALIAPVCASAKCTGTPTHTPKGSTISHAEVVPIFWGAYWTTGTAPTWNQVVGGIQYIVNGPYFAPLFQYDLTHGVGPVRMVPTAPIDTATVPTNYALSDFDREVNKLIGQGAVPPPVADASLVYTVFLPPGTSSSNRPFHGNEGYNVGGSCDSTCGSAYAGRSYRLALIFPGNPQNLRNYTRLFTHELAETIAGNVTITNCPGASSQIADICECHTEEQLGGTFTTSSYWSDANNGCVVPESWGPVWQYDDSPESWTNIGGAVRQIYAGPEGLFATGTDDNLYQYLGTPSAWGPVGSPGAMFGVGTSSILALAVDAGSVWRYSGSTWTEVGFTPASAVYSGGFDVATDNGGNPWQYLPNSNSWVEVGGPADQFVVGDSWLAALSLPHTGVWIFAGNGSSWIDTGHAASELYIGGHAVLAARDLTSDAGVSAMALLLGSVPQWSSMGGPGNMFALYGLTGSNSMLVGLTPSSAAIEEEIAPIQSILPTPSWIQIGDQTGRLVGGGAHLYATRGIVY